jgi:hypothetical protein
MIFGINPLIALGVLASTAATDAAYVFFNAAVTGRPYLGGKLERYLVFIIRIRGDQLYRKCGLCCVCSHGVVAWRVRLGNLAAAGTCGGRASVA